MSLRMDENLLEFSTKEGLSVVKLQKVTNVMYDNKGTEETEDWVIGFTADGARYGITCKSEDEAINMYNEIKKFM